MSELDQEEETVLDGARRALTPSSVVTKRMRAALLAKLAAPAAAAAAGGAAISATAAGTTAQLVEGAAGNSLISGGSLSGSAALGSSGSLASGAKVVASGAGALATGAKVAVSAAVFKAVAGVTTAALLATAAGYYVSPSQEAPPSAAPAPTLARPLVPGKRAAPAQQARSVVADPRPQGESTRAQPQSPAGSEAAPAVGVPQAAPDAGSQQQLQGELDALKRVRQALQAGDAQRALRLLAELDAAHPVSPLWQEREVARVLALCGAGRVSAARAAAQRLLGPNPNSLYADRIRASCAATGPEARMPATSPAESTQSTKVAPPVARFGDSGN